jgi:hypothetical protein
MLCISYYDYVFFSTKLEKRAEKVLPGSDEGWEKMTGGREQG